MPKNRTTRPNELRRATLIALLTYGQIVLQRDDDSRLKPLMGMCELGELMVTEIHASAPGLVHRKFVLTVKGRDAANRVVAI